MRVKVTFKADKLPILYRHRFMSLIKESLSISDAVYKESLYPVRNSEKSKIPKPFCFSVSMPSGRTTKKEKIIIDEGVEIEDAVFHFPQNSSLSFYISSYDYEFMVCLYNGLLEIKDFDFGNGITLKLERVFMLNEGKIKMDEVIFRTNSPILIEDKEGHPILPSASKIEHFNEHINAIHNRILKDIRGEGLKREMEFEPLKIRKQVVKHTLKGFREKTGKPYMTLTCFEGCFRLKGDPRDLQMLYQIGIGLRTGQGFGMVEVV
ncbi:CRISPR-associated endoribonuclease Cas6 [Dissulfurispira thermophila]|uniref:CRISPR-associated endoribonuclease Cas6 n=1 Tax=Dissulfurispira thermophila TaxID=2715679 RepID=A0A7G1H4I0_9BACT|nr:CRISPR-associated endoribonuclease Cas6 [Dissulfurispira thermophila]BCB96816.1 CRISPR-associated endoribonuclease Cas6 [Dissulfurispira thermophila]